MRDRAFLRLCEFTLSHCFKGTTCKHWSHDYITDFCHGKAFGTPGLKCTRFKEAK